jgi:hypothetical protein
MTRPMPREEPVTHAIRPRSASLFMTGAYLGAFAAVNWASGVAARVVTLKRGRARPCGVYFLDLSVVRMLFRWQPSPGANLGDDHLCGLARQPELRTMTFADLHVLDKPKRAPIRVQSDMHQRIE